MAAKIKAWFDKFLKSLEAAGMERARRHIEIYGYRKYK